MQADQGFYYKTSRTLCSLFAPARFLRAVRLRPTTLADFGLVPGTLYTNPFFANFEDRPVKEAAVDLSLQALFPDSTSFSNHEPIALYRFFRQAQISDPKVCTGLLKKKGKYVAWYNEIVVNSFLLCAQAQLYASEFALISSLVTNILKPVQDDKRVASFLKRNVPDGAKQFLLPYNINETHWVLFHLYVLDSGSSPKVVHLDCYDSMATEATPNPFPAFTEQLNQIVTVLSRKLKGQAWTGIPWSGSSQEWRGEVEANYRYFHPYQLDFENCGVFACFAGAMLMAGASAADITDPQAALTQPDLMDRMRTYVFETLRPYFQPKPEGR